MSLRQDEWLNPQHFQNNCEEDCLCWIEYKKEVEYAFYSVQFKKFYQGSTKSKRSYLSGLVRKVWVISKPSL